MICKKCQSENLVMRPNAKNPSATEVICGDCGAWQKFIGKDEIRLFEMRDSKKPGKTNADRIRSMSDEELLDFLISVEIDGIADTTAEVADWLQQPYKEET